MDILWGHPSRNLSGLESYFSPSWRSASRTQYQRKNAKKIFLLRVAMEKGQLSGWSSFLVILWEGRE